MKVKEESEKVDLKLNTQKAKSQHPVPSFHSRWGNNERVRHFIFGGSQITADGDFSHEIKKHVLLGRKVMINLDHILKSRDITLLTKV